MLLISSWIMTVLPTPAPPNAPTLPPFENGQTRSMTLIPVSRICTLVSCSVSVGAGRWIGYRFSYFTGPRLSIGSPVTLNRRPSTASPTGTVIGTPVSVTLMPRLSPSVEDMATERTQFSPRCCCTSRASFIGLPFTSYSISKALYIFGSAFSSGNSTSTTGPIT